MWAFRQRQNEVFKLDLKSQPFSLVVAVVLCYASLFPSVFLSFPLPLPNGSNGPSCLSVQSSANCKL